MRKIAPSALLALLAAIVFVQPSLAQVNKSLAEELGGFVGQMATAFFITNAVNVSLGGFLTEVGSDYIVISPSPTPGSDNVMPLTAIGYVRLTPTQQYSGARPLPKSFSQKLNEYANQKRQLQVLFITDQVQHLIDGSIVEIGNDYLVLRTSSTTTDIVPFSAIGFVRPH